MIENKIIELLDNRLLNININNETSQDDFEYLSSLPIPLVNHLSISINEWNRPISNFFSNNKIEKIKELEIQNAYNKSAEIISWIEGFIKISQKVTGNIELYNLKMEPILYGKFFLELDHIFSKLL